jgi:hypothetical protein
VSEEPIILTREWREFRVYMLVTAIVAFWTYLSIDVYEYLHALILILNYLQFG